MTYKIIWNGHSYWEEKIKVKDWKEFLRMLDESTMRLGLPPDLVYLISIRD